MQARANWTRWVLGLVLAGGFGCAVGQSAGGQQIAVVEEAQNSERMRPLDWKPFREELARQDVGRVKEIDGLLGKGGTIPMVQAALAARKFSAEELTLYFLARIQRHDDRLRSYVELNPQALEEARASDARRRAGRTLGPMDGIPVSLKDNIETAGPMHTTAGSAVLFEHVAAQDAPLVARLRAGGAVVLGKANLSEFAGAVTLSLAQTGFSAVGGQTRNPHGRYPAGGSSSGSAAGVSALLAMVSVGTETSGSLLAPASWNGVVGMKPSRNLVSGSGVVPLVKENDSPGPVARTVSDAAVLLDALDTAKVDYLAGLRGDALEEVTVGMLHGDVVANADNTPLWQGVSATLAGLGAKMRPVAFRDPANSQFEEVFLRYLAAGVRYDMLGYVAERAPGVKTVENLLAFNKAEAKRRIPQGQLLLELLAQLAAPMSAQDYAEMGAWMRQRATEILEEVFQRSGASVLVSFENVHSRQYATAGYPAICVPLGLRVKGSALEGFGGSNVGMPAAVTFIGKPGEDARLLAFAFAFEQATKLRVRPGIE